MGNCADRAILVCNFGKAVGQRQGAGAIVVLTLVKKVKLQNAPTRQHPAFQHL